MTRDGKERLLDVQEAITFIAEHVGGTLEAPEIDDEMALHAVLFNLIVIGEAIKRVGDDVTARAPEVRWSDYAGLRDVIAHQYFRLQKELIEATVSRELPTLRIVVQRLLSDGRHS